MLRYNNAEALIVRCFVKTKVQTKHETQDDHDGETNEETPPLELPSPTGMLNTLCQLHVAGFGVLLHVVGVLLYGLHGLVLQYDLRCEVFHQLVKVDDCPLDLLDVIVTSSDRAEDCGSGCAAIGFELYNLLDLYLHHVC